jgi:hypothetical protein
VLVTIQGKNLGSFNATPAGFGRDISMYGGVFWFTDVYWVSDTEITAICTWFFFFRFSLPIMEIANLLLSAPPGIGLSNAATVFVDGSEGMGGVFNYPAPTITTGQQLFAVTIGGDTDLFGSSFSPFDYFDAVDSISLHFSRFLVCFDKSKHSHSTEQALISTTAMQRALTYP